LFVVWEKAKLHNLFLSVSNRVAANHEVNKMTSDNLSLLFGPSMMGGKDNSVFEMPLQSAVLLFLMHNYSVIFVDELDPKKTPTPSTSK